MSAKFCPECGTATGGAKFCPECGTATTIGADTPAGGTPAPAAPAGHEEETVWTGSPDPILSPVSAKTHRYTITTERIIVDQGLIGKRSDTLDLFRVKDVKMKKSMTQRARGRGDVGIVSVDQTTPMLVLESVEKPDDVMELVRKLVTAARTRHGVSAIERM